MCSHTLALNLLKNYNYLKSGIKKFAYITENVYLCGAVQCGYKETPPTFASKWGDKNINYGIFDSRLIFPY